VDHAHPPNCVHQRHQPLVGWDFCSVLDGVGLYRDTYHQFSVGSWHSQLALARSPWRCCRGTSVMMVRSCSLVQFKPWSQSASNGEVPIAKVIRWVVPEFCKSKPLEAFESAGVDGTHVICLHANWFTWLVWPLFCRWYAKLIRNSGLERLNKFYPRWRTR
jgi:hypothetical protein